MKKLFSIILTLSLVTTLMLTLAACGGEIEPDLYDLARAAIGDEEVIPLDPPPEPTDDPEIPIEEPQEPKMPEEPIEVSIEVGNIIQFGDYDWRILDIQVGRALIITERIIERRAFSHADDIYSYIGWEDSELRAYLNDEFYNSFDEIDREKIIKVTNNNPDNPWLVAPSENDTENYIFLLSLDEVVQYFGNSGLLNDNILDEPMPVDGGDFGMYYWWIDDERREYPFAIDDEFNNERLAYEENGISWYWWLRSPALFSGGAAAVTDKGFIDVFGWYVGRANSSYGVRPAMWISVES
jgi:hypothetical protein